MHRFADSSPRLVREFVPVVSGTLWGPGAAKWLTSWKGRELEGMGRNPISIHLRFHSNDLNSSHKLTPSFTVLTQTEIDTNLLVQGTLTQPLEVVRQIKWPKILHITRTGNIAGILFCSILLCLLLRQGVSSP